ncbi:DUF4166 domain-containing protein [Chungangia koreensis]|uniref:DUF4166 domain-containing protein n=1 Tax=Chungangia koreensis TaxID=752657 RepID=A0ABV8X3P1_9LACT
MTIYKQALGEDFKRLHIKLQERYELPTGTKFRASGVMREISGGPKWLSPFFALAVKKKFLFPESGQYIPFTIVNHSFIDEEENLKVHWERTFFFGKKKRYFNALMGLNKENLIEDYLGEPALFYSDLICSVEKNRGMKIVSGKQRFMIGKWSLPLPRILQGVVEVFEGYNEDREVFTICVTIRNPLIGRLFFYEGEFREDDD